MGEHTPGKWEATHEADELPYALQLHPRSGSDEEQSFFASSMGVVCGDGNGEGFTLIHLGLVTTEDARLIAAAPDLLEALVNAERKLKAYAHGCPADKETHNTLLPMFRAAIAKARGESNG